MEDRFIYVGRTFDHLGYDLLIRKEPVFVYLVNIYQVLFGLAFLFVLVIFLSYMVYLRREKIPDVVDVPVWKWEYPFRVSGTMESPVSHNPLVAKCRVGLYNSYTYLRAVRARQVPVVITWDSRRDWDLPRWRRKPLLNWLREVEGQGVPIVVRDKYVGAGSYASRGELGEALAGIPITASRGTASSTGCCWTRCWPPLRRPGGPSAGGSTPVWPRRGPAATRCCWSWSIRFPEPARS